MQEWGCTVRCTRLQKAGLWTCCGGLIIGNRRKLQRETMFSTSMWENRFRFIESNHNGDTPLHFAARFGHTGAVQEFLKRSEGVSAGLLNVANNNKDMALHDATREGHADIVMLLVKAAGENVLLHKPNNLGETPLLLAAERGCFESFTAIIGHTCLIDLEHKGPCGQTALHLAVMCGNKGQFFSVCFLLLDHDDEYNSAAYIQDNEGQTPIHIATQNSNFNGAKLLIRSYPDCIEIVDNKGQNVVHSAANLGCLNTFERFLRKVPKCDSLINEKDGDGNTPLHLLVATTPTLPIHGCFFKLPLFLKRHKNLNVRVFNNKNFLNSISLGALMIAFVTGVYAVVSQFPGLAFTIIAISLFYFFFYLFLLVGSWKTIWAFMTRNTAIHAHVLKIGFNPSKYHIFTCMY
ncbi:uncharacterized protein LOC141592849 [Silene latifolia]|uniref:uncharacterized protein LOC141592849 n=1 Tax=Silene latifolia TaxID=37657 RepID=UPI003D771A7C